MKMSEASIWAEHGGLIGLIIFSLFGLIATFVVVLTRKDKSSRSSSSRRYSTATAKSARRIGESTARHSTGYRMHSMILLAS